MGAALTRLFDHYLHTAGPGRWMPCTPPSAIAGPASPRRPPPSRRSPDPTAARAWLEHRTDRASSGHGLYRRARLARPTRPASPPPCFFTSSRGGHYPETMTIHSQPAPRPSVIGDQTAEATALNHLAGVPTGGRATTSRPSAYLRKTLGFVPASRRPRRAGPGAGQPRPNSPLSGPLPGGHRSLPAGPRHIPMRPGDLTDKARRPELPWRRGAAGPLRSGRRHHRQALAIGAEIGASQIGVRRAGQPRYRRPAEGSLPASPPAQLSRPLAMCRQIGHPGRRGRRRSPGSATCTCGRVNPEEATRHMQRGVALYRELGNPSGEADALNSLGEVLLAVGQLFHARFRVRRRAPPGRRDT